jgi:predicted O-methyltransferase YrrM
MMLTQDSTDLGIVSDRVTKHTSRLELMPVQQLKAAQRQALRYLLTRRGGTQLGDYLEFGVYAGTSMRCMYEVMMEMDIHAPRLFGFDSFEGTFSRSRASVLDAGEDTSTKYALTPS